MYSCVVIEKDIFVCFLLNFSDMSTDEKLQVHLAANDLFFYIDGRRPRRVIRDWVFEPSILLLPSEIIVDEAAIDEEMRFKDSNVTSKIICKMVDDHIIVPRDFHQHFTRDKVDQIRGEMSSIVRKAKEDKTVSIVRDGDDIFFRKAGHSLTLINCICSEIIWRETGLPPIDADWRRTRYYYNWRFGTGMKDITAILRQRRAFNQIADEFSDIANPKNRILGMFPIVVPELELFPNLERKEYKRIFEKKTPDKWEDFVWKKTEENYGRLREYVKSENIRSLRETCRNFGDRLSENEKEASRKFRKELRSIYNEYTKPWGDNSPSLKYKFLYGFSYSSPIIGALMSAVWGTPILGSIGAMPVLPSIITSVHQFRFRRKVEHKEEYGWFFWLYDALSCTKYDKIQTLLDAIQVFKL
jgi:hypothetical protein